MYDMPEFYDVRWVYGRKLHHCIECRREIRPREFHASMSGKWDGKVETHRTCPHCVMLCRWVARDRAPDSEYGIGQVLFELADELHGCGPELLPVARAYAAAVWLQWRSRVTGELLPIPAKLPPRAPSPWERPRAGRITPGSGDARFTPEGWAAMDYYLPPSAT